MLVLIDWIYFDRRIDFYCLYILILFSNKLHRHKIVLNINRNKTNNITLIMYLINGSFEYISFLRNLLNPKNQLFLNLKRITPNNLIFLQDINIRIDNF